jgi:outer membrane biosynthesis protein TonB
MTILLAALMAVAGQADQSQPLKPLTNPAQWVTSDDYPPAAFQADQSGTSHFALTIDVTGKPDNCLITWTSGFAELDQYTCAIFLKRARFKPARDASGQPVRAVFSRSVSWRAFTAGSKIDEVPGIDLVVDVAKLPKDYARPALTRVHFGRSGKPDSCRVEVGSGSVAIDKVACEQVMIQAPAPTERINGGFKPDTRMVVVSFGMPAKN